jgi:hypothetical protein
MPDGPVVHLGSLRDGIAMCGRWSKYLTRTAANVTCEKCRATWDFAIAERESPGPKTGSSQTLSQRPSLAD